MVVVLGRGRGRRVSPCAHLLNIHNCCKKYRIIYSEGVGEVVVVLRGGWRESEEGYYYW